MAQSKQPNATALPQLFHDHSKCLELAGDNLASNKDGSLDGNSQRAVRPWNILLYIRKSDDVGEILDALQDTVLYISQKMESFSKQRRQRIYLEKWALDALESHMAANQVNLSEMPSADDLRTLSMPNKQVLLKEWNPEDETQGQSSVSISAPEYGMRPREAAEQTKEHIEFEYVFCIGGDGTLLRLLRILFFRFLPATLPKIVTFSMGSLGYLCNFKVRDLQKVLNATVLACESPSQLIDISYRSRLSCSIEDSENNTPVRKRMFVDSEGGKSVQPAICHALNEISITRGNAEFMCRFDVYINDTLLTIVQGDGVLISTPTGSTAYNLSCGGSIIHPASEVVALTPICPHSLSFRPIILPKSAKVTIVLPQEARTGAWVTFDGQMRFRMERNEKLVIRESAFCVPFVNWKGTNEDTSWVKKMRKNLQWNNTIIQKPLNQSGKSRPKL